MRTQRKKCLLCDDIKIFALSGLDRHDKMTLVYQSLFTVMKIWKIKIIV